MIHQDPPGNPIYTKITPYPRYSSSLILQAKLDKCKSKPGHPKTHTQSSPRIFLDARSTFLNPSDMFLNPPSNLLNPSDNFLNLSDSFQNPPDNPLNPPDIFLNPPDMFLNRSNNLLNPSDMFQNPSDNFRNPSDNPLNSSDMFLNPPDNFTKLRKTIDEAKKTFRDQQKTFVKIRFSFGTLKIMPCRFRINPSACRKYSRSPKGCKCGRRSIIPGLLKISGICKNPAKTSLVYRSSSDMSSRRNQHNHQFFPALKSGALLFYGKAHEIIGYYKKAYSQQEDSG